MNYQEMIRRLREKMLLTQAEFADYIGVSFATVNRWEKGHCKPTMKERRKLKELFEKYNVVEE